MLKILRSRTKERKHRSWRPNLPPLKYYVVLIKNFDQGMINWSVYIHHYEKALKRFKTLFPEVEIYLNKRYRKNKPELKYWSIHSWYGPTKTRIYIEFHSRKQAKKFIEDWKDKTEIFSLIHNSLHSDVMNYIYNMPYNNEDRAYTEEERKQLMQKFFPYSFRFQRGMYPFLQENKEQVINLIKKPFCSLEINLIGFNSESDMATFKLIWA